MDESKTSKAMPKHVIHTFSQTVFNQFVEEGGDVAVIQLEDDSIVPVTCTSLNPFAYEEIMQQCPDTKVMGEGGRLIGLYPAVDLKNAGWDNQDKIRSYIELKHAESNMIVSGVKSAAMRKSHDVEKSFAPCPAQNFAPHPA